MTVPHEQRSDRHTSTLEAGLLGPTVRRCSLGRFRGARRSPRSLNLALQGGGAHGAFTWGVLDRLAEVGDLDIPAISGTSAGAVNAVVFASGWLTGGPAGARAGLARLWQSCATGTVRLTRSGVSYAGLDAATQLLSPYQLNPFNLNPLREILTDLVDFPRLRRERALKLFIAATNLRTGALRIFENQELTLEAVLASACLPSLHHAVEIDGDAYWDGGYVSNPPLVALVEGSKARDCLLVRINVIARSEHPRSASAIRSRVGEIVFDQPLERELAVLKARSGALGKLAVLPIAASQRRVARHRLHVIGGGDAVAALDPATRVLANAGTLEHLRELGNQAAGRWLGADAAG